MVETLERMGARLLNRLVPQAVAQATQCACDPGYCWCVGLASKCCCAANCQYSTCYCPVKPCS